MQPTGDQYNHGGWRVTDDPFAALQLYEAIPLLANRKHPDIPLWVIQDIPPAACIPGRKTMALTATYRLREIPYGDYGKMFLSFELSVFHRPRVSSAATGLSERFDVPDWQFGRPRCYLLSCRLTTPSSHALVSSASLYWLCTQHTTAGTAHTPSS
jgi:hypothetical protein